jgi:hypothetical protein
MGPRYKFTWKRRFFKRSRIVVSNYFVENENRMILVFEDGSVYGIPKWSECSLWLGTDWVRAKQKEMERQAGQSVPLNTNEAPK